MILVTDKVNDEGSTGVESLLAEKIVRQSPSVACTDQGPMHVSLPCATAFKCDTRVVWYHADFCKVDKMKSSS